MENGKVSAGKIALNYGLILGVIIIVYSLILYLLDVPTESLQKFGWGNYIFFVALMVLGIKTYRDKYAGGFITYGKSFSTGFLIGLYASILAAIYAFIYFSYINPGIIEEMIDIRMVEIMEQNPNMGEQEYEMSESWIRRFMSPVALPILGLISNVIVSLILSLIVSIFMQKRDKTNDGVA